MSLCKRNRCRAEIAHNREQRWSQGVANVYNALQTLQVMIAEAEYRRKGYAKEAVTLLMHYGVQSLGVTRYFCKVRSSRARRVRLIHRCTRISIPAHKVNATVALSSHERCAK
jgi:Acetyltransferase (GNAT) domain